LSLAGVRFIGMFQLAGAWGYPRNSESLVTLDVKGYARRLVLCLLVAG